MRLAALLVPVLAVACVETPPPIEPQVTSRVERKVVPVRGTPQLDLLFVIDSSPQMARHRERLETSLPGLITGLEQLSIGLPSLHLGVITADVGGDGCSEPGDDGRLRPAGMLNGTFLSDVPAADGTRVRNYTGELIEVFRELVDVGTAGCELSRPFEAVRRALDDHPVNTGFRRPDAYLAVLFVTASDDASPAPVADYIAELGRAAGVPDKLVVGTISGEPTGSSCGEAPAPRLHQLAEAFHAGRASICSEDVTPSLVPLAELLRTTLELACWESDLLDLDPATPALEPDCEGWLTGPRLDEDLPACPAGPATTPCYRIDKEDSCADVGSGYSLRIDGTRDLPDAPMHATVECLVDSAPR